MFLRARAERHADADLLRLPCDEKSHDAVDSDRRERHTHRREERKQHGVEARALRKLFDAMAHALDFDGQQRILRLGRFAHPGSDGVRVERRSHKNLRVREEFDGIVFPG